MWDLTWGSKVEFLKEIAAGATTEEEIPQCLRNRPILNQFQEPIFQMYRDLASSRQYTATGVAEIPYHVKIIWLDENEIDDKDERRDYLFLLYTIDAAFLKHFYEKNG